MITRSGSKKRNIDNDIDDNNNDSGSNNKKGKISKVTVPVQYADELINKYGHKIDKIKLYEPKQNEKHLQQEIKALKQVNNILFQHIVQNNHNNNQHNNQKPPQPQQYKIIQPLQILPPPLPPHEEKEEEEEEHDTPQSPEISIPRSRSNKYHLKESNGTPNDKKADKSKELTIYNNRQSKLNNLYILSEEQRETIYKKIEECINKKQDDECWYHKKSSLDIRVNKEILEIKVKDHESITHIKCNQIIWYFNTKQNNKSLGYQANNKSSKDSEFDEEGYGYCQSLVLLCGNKKCLNHSHMLVECSQKINRNSCHTFVSFKSLKKTTTCPHIPSCIGKNIIPKEADEQIICQIEGPK